MRVAALFGVTASVLGLWSPAVAPAAVSAAQDAALVVVAPGPLRPATLDLRTIRPEIPRGYATVEQRAAQAAAEQAAAAAAQTAAEAAAKASAPAAPSSSSRTPTPRTPTTPKPTAPAPTRLPLGVDPGASAPVVPLAPTAAEPPPPGPAPLAPRRGPGRVDAGRHRGRAVLEVHHRHADRLGAPPHRVDRGDRAGGRPRRVGWCRPGEREHHPHAGRH